MVHFNKVIVKKMPTCSQKITATIIIRFGAAKWGRPILEGKRECRKKELLRLERSEQSER